MSKKQKKQVKSKSAPTPKKPDSELTTEDIAEYLKKVRFRSKIFGGADNFDVWKKIKRIDEMYSHVMDNQKIHYEALIEEREQWYKAANEKCKMYEQKYGKPTDIETEINDIISSVNENE